MQALKKLLGVTLVLLGVPFALMALSDLVTGSDPETGSGVLLGLVAFFSGVTYSGVHLLRAKPKAAALAPPLEVLALRAAKSAGGTIGVAALASQQGLSLEDARKALDACARQGACRLIVDENGLELYRFDELALSPGEAAKARDVLA